MGKVREHCKQCGVFCAGGAGLSRKGLCLECKAGNAVEAAEQMSARSGPYYDNWVAAMKQRNLPIGTEGDCPS